MKIFYTLFTILLVTSMSYGQEVVQGKVLDENGLPLIGATILIDGLDNTGAITDLEGKFYLFDVPQGKQTLKISFIGYTAISQDIEVNGPTEIESIKLEPGVLIGDEVLILGDRLKGQAKAINRQRTNQNITNVVAADQIGRFPDTNIGDAVKRIPGITMQGDQGEARNIVIRGLAPQLNSVMINGNRIPSAEGDNRNIQMDLIPSDMIQTIEVSKAVTPDMDADAIGGAINLVTRSTPSGQRISGTLASGYNFLSEKPIWTGGLIYGNRFLDDKLGAVVSLSYNNHNLGSDNVEFEWSNEGENDLNGDGEDDEFEVSPYITDMEIRNYNLQRIRRSASVNLDYKINSNNTIFLKSMYNWRDDWENRFRYRITDIAPEFADGSETITGFTGESDIETKGGIGNDRVDNRRLEDQRVISLGLSGEHLIGRAKLTWDGFYAKASEERPNERYIGYKLNDTYDVNVDLSDMEFPLATPINSSDFALSNYEFDELTEEFQYTEDQDFNARVDLELPLSVIPGQTGKFKVGSRLRTKSKERENSFFSYEPIAGDDISTMNLLPLISETDADFLPGSQYVAGQYVDPTYLGAMDLTNSSLFEETDEASEYLSQNYTASETITGGYFMLNQNLSSKFSVLAGLRVEHTSIDYEGNEVENEEDFIQRVTNSESYTDYLPGVHLKYNASNNLVIRAAWTNTLARPNYFDLVPYVDNRIEDEELFIGNPNLDPTRATNIDFMAENYFESIGLISAGYFYKSVDGFIYTSATEDEATGFDLFQPQNGGTGTINGVELAFQRQLDFLPGALKGLGIYLNYTYTSSSADGVADEDGELRDDLGLPGTAKNLFNGSLSYENKKLIVRASVNYSGDYVDEVGGSAFSDRYYDEQFFLDINGSYAIKSGLRIFFEANNLTDQPLRYYQGDQARTMQVEYYNRRFNMGIKFDMFK